MPDRKLLPGKFIWFELVSTDPARAQAFYGEVVGWRVVPWQAGPETYEMIYSGETMLGGYAAPASAGEPARWLSYVSVADVDAAARTAAANGGKVVQAPFDAPGAGRMARILDPQGAELCLFTKETDDPADREPSQGEFFWTELHTPDPVAALAFYEKVVGFSNRALDMGPAGTYHIISGGGADRGGVSAHILPGERPYWLPYIKVDDPDAAVARARKLGGTVQLGPIDIPNAGRAGYLADPTGASIAVMHPLPPRP
jgi:predicted enzyme related to lactoylglutathione lyase